MAEKIHIDWEVVDELFGQGLFAREVAEILGIELSTFYSRMRREGYKNPNPVGRPTNEVRKQRGEYEL